MKKFCLLILCVANVLFADIFVADPSIFYHDGTYYLVGTDAFDHCKSFTIYTSKDFKNWSNKNQAGKIQYALDSQKAFTGKRCVAPQLLKYKDKFIFAYSEYRLAFAKADTPLGPFVQDKPACISAKSKQIDPFVFIDDDGKRYVYFSFSTKHRNWIYVAEIDETFTKLTNLKPCICAENGWENTANHKIPVTVEGPTVIKRNGKYVLFYSANDFRDKDYAVGYAVSDSPTGEWTRAKNNPIIRRDIVGHAGAGHGDVFFDSKGDIWYVFHTHYSDKEVAPRRTAIIKLKESFENGIPKYEVIKETFRFL
ncbi:MAG: glycoside hydrolase family 43 protein [Opitutales bacterium]|nr:glycoside hydrolase family 43 protein [Opitutales bacterium]